MKTAITIEPVLRRRRGAAIRFLVGGDDRGAISEARAAAMRQVIDLRGEGNVRLWWARRKRRRLAAATIIESAGKTGMLFNTPATAKGVEADPLVALIRATCRDALERGMVLVQSLVEPGASEDVEVLEAAGLERLARLVNMKLALTDPPPRQDDPWLTWRDHDEFTEAELGEVIRCTYEGSLDCPGLTGVREMKDIIAGHRASGVFHPEAWWLVQRSGRPAGCILVNDSATAPIAEIVYMGVPAEHRGCGIGRAMLCRAIAEAHQRRLVAVSLAVDAENRYARRLYEQHGFRQTDTRLVYVILRRSPDVEPA